MTVTPAIPGMKVFANEDRITIRGQTQGRTQYTVTLADTLADRYGQTLGQRTTLRFNVGAAQPRLFPDNAGSIVLDPAAPKQYIAYSINVPALRVRIYAVAPEDYPAYDQFRGGWQPWPPGRLVFDKVIAPRGVPDAVTATPIDLSPALSSGLGHAIVMVTAADEKTNGRNTVWVQSTQLGLMTYTEFKALTAWVTRLSDGSPVEGARISVLGTRASGASGASDESGTSDTGRDGLVRVPVAAWDSWKNGWEKRFIVATRGADSAIVENYPPLPYGASAADMQNLSRQARWLVYDDRGVYKPGEEVRIKGWIRRAVAGRGGDLAAIANGGGKTLRFLVRDPLGAEISQGKAAIDDQGSFDLAFKLPGNANLGHANIEFDLEQARSNHSFQIQEFRTPEFEVGVKASEGPYFAGSNATATLTAAYYAGGGLASAPVGWRVQRTIATFAPPNHSDYHFGPQARDWWLPPVDGGIQTQTWSARTNAQGIHRIRLDFDTPAPPYPMHLDLHGQVTDVNRQQWSGQTRLLVHPASAYVGVRLEQNFVRAGAAVNLSLIVTGIDGKALSGRPITVRAARVDWVQQGDTFEDKEVDAQTCTATSGSAGADQPARCTFKPMQGGPWRITARVTDAQGRENQTVSTLWVMGEASAKPRALGEDRLTVMADKKEYPPGDTAELLVLAPFAPAEGVLTVRRQGLVHIERFTLHGPTQTLKVKLDESMVPNVQIGVDLVGTASREHSADPAGKKPRQRPAYAHASINVNVLPISRTLTVTATPQALSAEPGAATSIGVTVKDARGHPVKNAAVALVVADEAVLALTGYKTPDPVQVFYAPRAPEVRDSSLYPQIVLAEPDLNLGAAQRMALLSLPIPAPAMPAAAGLQRLRMDSAPTPVEGIRVRSDFAALALFAPSLRTDAAGQAVARFKLPDNLTRYRVMAVASASARDFGANEATLTARLPLMVRPSAPRFLNFGDRFELPVVVQNQTDATTDVGIAVRAANAVIDDPAAKRVTLAAHDRVEVRFAAHAGKPGTARFQIGIASKNFADASEIELPVYTPATTQAFATYGEIDSDASGGGAGSAIAQPVQMPAGVFTAFGGLQISTSSTQLSALTDAFLYLLKYPYECNEQVASRILAVAALRDVLTAFKAEGMPAPQAIAASMKADLARLKRTQDPSGGWGFWSEAPWPFISTHVTYALVRAQEKGYAPDASTMTRARDYLRAIESHIPGGYPADARRAVIAYALYVRKRMGDADPARAKALIAEAGGIGKLPIEAIGWIWPTLAADKSDPGSAALDAAIRTELQNRVTETASTAHFVSGYRDADWLLLSSERRADSVLLEALIEVDPSSDLIPKLVRGLLAHRKAGRWANTQESAFVLLALERYFSAYEKTTPDFVARVWLDDQYAGQHAFKGHTSETSTINVPMQWLANKARQAPLNNAPDRQNLVIGKNGPGRLYYRIGMQYAPGQLTLAPVDNGFTVSRTYESVDHAADVQRDARGTWHIKAGARVRVQVTMVAPARRYHVALDDPLPAGLEVLNPALAVTGALPKDPNDPNDPKAIGQASRNGGPYGDWSRTWYEHQNIRDDRVQAYASQLWEGVWNYVYVARATTPGVYTAPPAKAEEMYAPETFGHSSSDRVIVE
ncbi:MAG: hypothetical protein LBV61_02735 [Burkholderiaceae bacterium]|nr:hypothetical protein [Burkholderiaceae bacterium]